MSTICDVSRIKNVPRGTSTPAIDGVAITPSDNDELSVPVDAIYVGVNGDITLIPVNQSAGGTALLFKNCQQGTILPVTARQVKSTGTTATNLIGLTTR